MNKQNINWGRLTVWALAVWFCMVWWIGFCVMVSWLF
jgi:hypothetical protein